MKILFIGIGKMGLPMAQHLAAKGNTVKVIDQDVERIKIGIKNGLIKATNSREDYLWADYIFSSLPNDEAFLIVADQVEQYAQAKSIYIDTSTISLSASQKVASKLKQKNIPYLRVAVSGNNHMAEAAMLTILASGDKNIYERVLPLLASWGPKQYYLGEQEQARLMKLVVNLLIAQTSAMLSEALTLGRLGNLDWSDMWQVLSNSAVGSPIIKAKSEQLGSSLELRDFSPTFTVHQMLKDLTLIKDAATDLAAPIDQTTMTYHWLQQVIQDGEGDLDYAAVIRLLERRASLATDLN